MRYLFLLCFLLIPFNPVFAAVDIAIQGKDPVRLEDVYQQGGIPYIAIEDVLDVVGLSGHWDSIGHVFKIKTKHAWAEISPASSYLKISDEYYPLKDNPRFIDGRLRVTDSFILNQLAQLAGRSIYFRNLDPSIENVATTETNVFERLFAFLLHKKSNSQKGPLIRAVAIDPGHGGLDTGVIAPNGYKEKQLNLEIAKKLAKQLKMKLGIPIYLSRDGDYELTMEQRLHPATRDDVDVWLLLHAQASFSPDVNGVTLFVRPEEIKPKMLSEEENMNPESASLGLAKELKSALLASSIPVLGIYPSARLSLGRGDLPTVQIELGFLSNPDELQKLQTPEYQKQLVQALYTGIYQYAQQSKEKKDGIN